MSARVTEPRAMGLSVQLLGSPRLERDGVVLPPPRGLKAWGLLAYLACTRVPPSREHLASLLFSDAEDPLGALRWSLSTLRQRLGEDVELGGDPLTLRLAAGTHVDVAVLAGGYWTEAVALPGIGGELLDGLAFRSSPGFALWLDSERRHIAGVTSGILHTAALASLGRGDAAAAAGYAAEVVRLNPYDENAHVLLVRCLRATGDAVAAERQVETCVTLFRRELGVEPTSALTDALHEPNHMVAMAHVSDRTAVLAHIEAGESMLGAGASETGVLRLRTAVALARQHGDSELLATALVAVGGALVHAARGTDEEGAVLLHEGIALAERAGRNDIAARGWREIAWIQFLRAQHERVEKSVGRTLALANGLELESAWAEVIRGSSRHDIGDHATAAASLRSAIARAEALDAGPLLVFALTMLGRLHLLRGEIGDATRLLERSLIEASIRNLTAFVPWPESFLAEVELSHGALDAAQQRFEHAFALGCEVGDPCWEGIALRGLGVVAAARGAVDRAVDLLGDALLRCRRLPDTYLWIEAYTLDARCAIAVDHHLPTAARWIDGLEHIAARRGFRELVLRATVYRARIGQPGALDAARLLADQVDSPAAAEMVAAAELSAV